MLLSKWDSIVLHCTYRPGRPDRAALDWHGIVRHHVEVLYYDYVGYHAGVERVKGHLVVCPGRPLNREGAHCRGNGMNRRAIGVAVIGNFDLYSPDKETYFLTAQLCQAIMCKFPKITVDRIFPHSDFSTKTCPGVKFDVDKVKYLITHVI